MKYKEYLITEGHYKLEYLEKIKSIDSRKFIKVRSVNWLWSGKYSF